MSNILQFKQKQLKPAPKQVKIDLTMQIVKKTRQGTTEIIGNVPNAAVISSFLETFGYPNYTKMMKFSVDVKHLKATHASLTTSIRASQYVPKEAHSDQSIKSINGAIEIHSALHHIISHPVFEGESLVCVYK